MRILTTAFTVALLASANLAAAQTGTPTPAAPGAATPAKPKPAEDKAARAAKSKDCSTQADAKSLHGEARKKFREACKRGA